ncbi:interleukin-31 receptor subunit alpha [Rhineura floridana]|uniref:interleukin-31 receptor subunit alpha n=1 Tax=Rhineura floridana TaxID=261503 RepID=UPI002AC7EBF5|nr:interleukin-31 receptor subunit alpha [Rhineura floridana]XP_061473998.1 interleukin-31 receptor subunit alpha [Rhineura floridana]XP_061474006.1 interleukin-31 receptor subunit alpha [Rhineura floridana]XP_061474016.1 interleukin-31 receptor subunit alpha [Rhineura floridana]XP_061474026.1 interleukin-31 receptor subunit alpha [Rhineura floridana]XP_061474034.1 interleukin-31 receptor subunit alpha [Rhineura floridana]XP_061474044.1 interleukin-31 receptor subunit alpha [Rhineura floridan
MFYMLFGILTILCRFCLADGDDVAHIFPSFPLIERGSTLKVFCILGKTLFPYKNASHIIWTLNDDVIAKENYQIINESVSGVAIHNFTYRRAHIKCFVDSPVEKQRLAYSEVKSGFPPQKPGNISCIFYYRSTLNCSWTSETQIATDYILFRNNLKSNCSVKNSLCSLCSCALLQQPFSDREYCVQVKAVNLLGEAMSECVRQKSPEILKPDSPRISEIKPLPGMKQMLRVVWEKPRNTPQSELFPVKCQIRYKATMEDDTKDANVIMKKQHETFNLTDLSDFTNYSVVIRCTLNESRFWSEWSSKVMGTTEEQAPLKVDLWRVIELHQPTGNRTVHLLWKKRKEFPSSGIINGYRIKYLTESNTSFEYTIDSGNKTVSSLNLTGEACEISVVAYNVAGDSPEAILRIQSIYEESKFMQSKLEHPRIVSLNDSALKEQLFLEWKASDLEINEYIIEWYDELETDPYKRSWQNIRKATNWTSPKGAFKNFTCYKISVYPLHKGEIEAPSSIRTYFHEGSPLQGPAADIENVDKNEATIKWKEIAKADRRGDIINYTVFYKAEGGKELGETVHVGVLQHRLKFLQADTKYTAYVMASTIAGGTKGTEVTFVTLKLSVVDIVLINVVVGIFMLCVATVGLLWALKRHKLKSVCWPEIPHPVLPSCSDGFQEKIMLRNSPSENETLVSVLKVDACGKDHDELQLSNHENCFKQASVNTEYTMDSHGILCSGGHKAITPLVQTASLEHDLRSPTIPTLEVASRDGENKEVQDQSDLKEKTDFNPYLKNSVRRREFLPCVNSDQNTKGTKAQPVSVTGQPYVALDTFQLFSKR